jgi:protein-disulfide isomerase
MRFAYPHFPVIDVHPYAEAAEAARASGRLDKVQSDIVSGARSGVNGTPTFFISGMR